MSEVFFDWVREQDEAAIEDRRENDRLLANFNNATKKIADQQATIERLKNLLREALNALERRQVPDETRNSYENAERVIKRIAAALGEQP